MNQIRPHIITFAENTAPSGGINFGGGSGGSGDKHYSAEVTIANATWIVVHNLSKIPAVTLTDPSNVQIMAEVTHDSTNQLTIRFNTATTGKVFLN